MATNSQKTVPEFSLRLCKVVETINAAEQKRRAKKLKIGKIKKYFDDYLLMLYRRYLFDTYLYDIRRYLKYELSDTDTRYFQK